jgi:hypothetical protein
MCSGDLKPKALFRKKRAKKGFLEKNPPFLNTLEVAYEITKNLKI